VFPIRSRSFAANSKNIASQIRLMRRNSIQSLKNKGFCNPVTFRRGAALLRFVPEAPLGLRVSDVASSGIAAAAKVRFADRFEDQFFEAVAFAARFGASRGARGGKPAGRVSTQQSVRQTELIENNVIEQRLAVIGRSRLRVICATPFQKRPFRYRSERFLYCVCRNLR
jgi:hypothetical protein